MRKKEKEMEQRIRRLEAESGNFAYYRKLIECWSKAHTEAAGLVNFQEIAALIVDGKPIEREKQVPVITKFRCPIQTVTPEETGKKPEMEPVVHAKWTFTGRVRDVYYYRCSACRNSIGLSCAVARPPKDKRCSDCGAHMDEPSD